VPPIEVLTNAMKQRLAVTNAGGALVMAIMLFRIALEVRISWLLQLQRGHVFLG
jgi:hypothetical protein